MPAKKKKPPVKTIKPKVRRKVAKRTKAKPVTVLTPLNTVVQPSLAPVLPVAVEPMFKELSVQPGNRLKVWLSVLVVMVVIIVIWAISVSQRIFQSTALEDTMDRFQVDEFVGNVNAELSDLKANVDEFSAQNQTNTNTAPSSEQLDNLFSDLQ